jgi:hypothetical protein
MTHGSTKIKSSNIYIYIYIYIYSWLNNPSGTKLPHFLGFEITLKTTAHCMSPSERAISPTQRPLPEGKNHSQKAHVSGGIQTRNPSKRAAADPRLRPRRFLIIQRTYNGKNAVFRKACSHGNRFQPQDGNL